MCLDRVSGEVFEDLSHISVVESVGGSFSFRCVCVLAVPSSVPVVTVLFVNVTLLNRRPFLFPESAVCVLWKAKNI